MEGIMTKGIVPLPEMTYKEAEKVERVEAEKVAEIKRRLKKKGYSGFEITHLFNCEKRYVAIHLQRTPVDWCVKIFDRVIQDQHAL